MSLNDFSRLTLLLALLALASACSKAVPGQDAARNAEKAVRDAQAVHRTLDALPPACTLGTTGKATQGRWLAATNGLSEPGHPYTFIQLFDTAATTSAVRTGLNREALRALDKVEFRDAEGKWIDAGPVAFHEAPAGCDYVWLQQDLGSARRVLALRFSFRPSAAPVTLADAGVLLAGAGGKPQG
jgi:hypothetical protein